jgi:hypothetical protein
MTDPVSKKDLIKVLTINKSMVKQIEMVPCDLKPGSLHQEISKRLAENDTQPVGWIPNSAMYDDGPSRLKFWLVKHKAQWFWYLPPDSGPIFDLHNPGLEQLFV